MYGYISFSKGVYLSSEGRTIVVQIRFYPLIPEKQKQMKHSVVRGGGCGMAMRGVSGPVEPSRAHGRRGVSAEMWHTGGLTEDNGRHCCVARWKLPGDARPHMKKRKHLRQHGTAVWHTKSKKKHCCPEASNHVSVVEGWSSQCPWLLHGHWWAVSRHHCKTLAGHP